MSLKNFTVEAFDHTVELLILNLKKKVSITYHNRTPEELQEFFAAGDKTVAELVLYIVKEWDLGYELTKDELQKMETQFRGVAQIVIDEFHKSRVVTVAKN